MSDTLRSWMIHHGIYIVVLGLLAGFPYAMVVTGQMVGEPRAWSMAHAEGVQNGLLVLAVAGGGGRILLEAAQARLCAMALVLAGYANVVASILGASTGHRGLGAEGPIANFIVFALFSVAIVAVFLGLGLAALGAQRGARA